LSDPENTKEATLPDEQSAEAAPGATRAPEPTATGDEKIAVLKHEIYRKGEEAAGVELAVKNVSDITIGSALFEAVFYDADGHILSKAEHKATRLLPHAGSRTVRIASPNPERGKVASYRVRLVKTMLPPAPTATGNDKITILKHHLREMDLEFGGKDTNSVELTIRNITNTTIASAVFEAVFYDIEGNIVDTVRHKEIELKPGTGRGVLIKSSIQLFDMVKSYGVRLIRATTADVERVQFRGHVIRTTETGEDEIRAVVKNVSDVKTDAAFIAAFYDSKGENIGTKVVILKDIEPGSVRQAHFLFKPREGDIVRTCNFSIGDIEG